MACVTMQSKLLVNGEDSLDFSDCLPLPKCLSIIGYLRVIHSYIHAVSDTVLFIAALCDLMMKTLMITIDLPMYTGNMKLAGSQ